MPSLGRDKLFAERASHYSTGDVCDVNDLPTLDGEVYRNLMLLRDYSGDVSDLALSFTITDSELGENQEVRRTTGQE
jgi:hypothetical protein